MHRRNVRQMVPLLLACCGEQSLLELDDRVRSLRRVLEHNQTARVRDEKVRERVGGRVVLGESVQTEGNFS